MNKKRVRQAQISLFIAGVFFLSCLYMNVAVSLDGGSVLREVTIDADANGMEVFQQQLSEGLLKITSRTGMVQIKHSAWKKVEKNNMQFGQYTYMTMMFSISGVLYLKGKGRLFVHFIISVFHKARFLYELFIQKEKDGKKWYPAIV